MVSYAQKNYQRMCPVMYLISPDKKQYKANLHCHSTISDGNLTPEQLKEAYKGQGYSVLCITDHEIPADHSHLTDKDFPGSQLRL